MDEVWKSAAQFLGALNGENIKRDSYVSTPEYREALAAWGKKEQEWEKLLAALPSDTAESLQEIKECLEDYTSETEKRAYVQGYVDCVQVLHSLGLLKGNPRLQVPGM